MPLKILIALAIVNQSHPGEVFGLCTSFTRSRSCPVGGFTGCRSCVEGFFSSVNPAEIAAGNFTAVHTWSEQEQQLLSVFYNILF